MSVSRTLAVSFGLSLCLTPFANAQFLSLTNPSIKDSLCVGADCLVDEAGNPFERLGTMAVYVGDRARATT